ncbi:MAG: hypothetical protein JWL77_2564 [Chthonomonadaceae bacterium]|nr:hypothetical protein [Chthonomonadaceae bacterium]
MSRQILALKEGGHLLPGNALLPAHEGMIITRGLQEWACLLPQDLPFAPVARLLGWQSLEEELLCASTLRNLVRAHGQIVRQAEQEQVQALLSRTDLATLSPELVVASHVPRRRAGWPQALTQAVDTALIAGSVRPPEGVSAADWERVLFARREEATRSVLDLRHLGPALELDQILVTVDEVLTRKPQKRCFWELRTARLLTPEGTRYFSGTGDSFLLLLTVFLQVCLGKHRHLLVLADGARWIRHWYHSLASLGFASRLLLDWYHLCHKCREMASLICRGRTAKKPLLKVVLGCLWQGQVAEAITALEEHRPQAKNVAKLDELIGYLRDRAIYIPNYRERRREHCYIGSGHVEKANDLLVAQRQKGHGMHWSLETSDALAALRTLMLNGGWERYWRDREVLPLVKG